MTAYDWGFLRAALLALLTSAVLASLILKDQPDELDQEQALYCEMVETFKTTGGEYGWPDYKGTYQEYCK